MENIITICENDSESIAQCIRSLRDFRVLLHGHWDEHGYRQNQDRKFLTKMKKKSMVEVSH